MKVPETAVGAAAKAGNIVAEIDKIIATINKTIFFITSPPFKYVMMIFCMQFESYILKVVGKKTTKSKIT